MLPTHLLSIPTSIQKALGIEINAAVSLIYFCEMIIRLLSIRIHEFIHLLATEDEIQNVLFPLIDFRMPHIKY